jgi:tetratricopeptide (TPR) repeat protein
MLGQYERVKDFVRDIITTAQQISSESLMGSAYLVAGRMLIYQAKPFAALRQLEEADRLVTQTRLFASRPQLLAFRAVALILLGRGDEAQPLLDQARGLAQSSGSREAVALVDMFTAVLMLSRHDGLKALPLAQSAAQVYTEEQARFEQAWALRVVGSAYRELGQLKQSRKAYDEAKSIFQAIGNQHQVGVTTEEAER